MPAHSDGNETRRTSPARVLLALELMSDFDVSPEELLTGTGLTEADISDPEAKTSSAQFTTLLRNMVRLTGRSDIGFLLGNRIKASVYGMYGYALMCAPTLRDALDAAVRYQSLTAGLDNHEWLVDGKQAVWLPVGKDDLDGLGFSDAEAIAMRYFNVAAAVRVLKDIMGPWFRVDQITLPGSPTAHAGAMARELQSALIFDQPRTEVRFDAALLDRSPQLANPVTAAEVSRACAQLLDQIRLNAGITRRVYHELTSSPGRFPDLETVASTLCMTSRTLRRKLTAEGTSFRDLLDEVRCALAQDYLKTSDMPIDDVAFVLGFTDGQSFRRAYRRWTGQTPSDARA